MTFLSCMSSWFFYIFMYFLRINMHGWMDEVCSEILSTEIKEQYTYIHTYIIFNFLASSCPSVSVYAVHCGSQGRCTVQGINVLSRQVPVCPFRHFCYSSHKMHRKKTNRRKREREFFWDRQSGVHWSCYVLYFADFGNYVNLFGLSRSMVTLEWIE